MKYTVTNGPRPCFATVEVDIPSTKCGDIELQEHFRPRERVSQKKLTAGLDTSDVSWIPPPRRRLELQTK